MKKNAIQKSLCFSSFGERLLTTSWSSLDASLSSQPLHITQEGARNTLEGIRSCYQRHNICPCWNLLYNTPYIFMPPTTSRTSVLSSLSTYTCSRTQTQHQHPQAQVIIKYFYVTFDSHDHYTYKNWCKKKNIHEAIYYCYFFHCSRKRGDASAEVVSARSSVAACGLHGSWLSSWATCLNDTRRKTRHLCTRHAPAMPTRHLIRHKVHRPMTTRTTHGHKSTFKATECKRICPLFSATPVHPSHPSPVCEEIHRTEEIFSVGVVCDNRIPRSTKSHSSCEVGLSEEFSSFTKTNSQHVGKSFK